MRKIQKCLEIQRALELEGIQIGEDKLLPCPLHKGKDSYMKWYEELNAVACVNPDCSCYQQVYSPIDLLQVLGGRTKTEAKKVAEMLLIEELEEYRRKARNIDKYEEDEPLEPKPFVLTEGARKFLKELDELLKRFGRTTFMKREAYEGLEINERTLKYYLRTLQKPGYIEVREGNRHRGYVYDLMWLPEGME